MIVERNVPEEVLQRAVNCGNSLSHCHQLLAGPLITQHPMYRCISCCHALVMDLLQEGVTGVLILKDSSSPVLASLFPSLWLAEGKEIDHTHFSEGIIPERFFNSFMQRSSMLFVASAVPSDFKTPAFNGNILHGLHLGIGKCSPLGYFGLKLCHLIPFRFSIGWFASLKKLCDLHLHSQWALLNMTVIFQPKTCKWANFKLHSRTLTLEILKLKLCELATLQESYMLNWIENCYQIQVDL